MTMEHFLIENETLKESLYHYRLEPDFDLYVLPRPGYQKKYAIFATRFGSIDNSFRVAPEKNFTELPDGVAHFLEHKLFEDEKGSVFDRFAGLGASANAFTSFTQTAYLFSATANFSASLKELLRFVQEPYFTEETVAKEQGIIGQEIKMYEDHPPWRIFFNLLGALYQKHPVRDDIAGTTQSIARITPELLYNCYNTFYHPSNMAMFVTGDLDPEEIARQVESDLLARGYEKAGQIIRNYPEEPDAVLKERVEQELVVSDPIFYLGFKDTKARHLGGAALLRREILMELLLDIIFGTSEPLYNELYQKDLIDEGFGFEYTAERGYAHTMIGGETKNPDLVFEHILKALESLKQKGISEETFERHRRKLLGGYIRRFNSLEYIANNYLAYRFKDSNLFDLPRLLQEAEKEAVMALAEENLDLERHAVSVIKPSA